MTWKERLHALVQTGRYGTQADLVAELAAGGFVVHQGSVSRELRRLGAIKVRGVYVIADDSLGAPVHDARVTAGGCLVVLKTEPAFASVLGQAVDDAELSGILGTIAGDDTVFVATSGPEGLAGLAALLDLPLEA